MADRWVRTSVALFDQSHDLFPTPSDPACHAFAWLDLIALARWKDSGGLKRGQLRLSQRFLSVRWARSLGWVNRLLQELAQKDRITRTRNPSHRERESDIITICKYDTYQTTTSAGMNTDGNTSGNADGYTDGNKLVNSTSTSTKKHAPSPVATWVTPFLKAWTEETGGIAPGWGECSKYLGTLYQTHGTDKVVAHLRYYLQQSNGKSSFKHFATTFGKWAPEKDPMAERSSYASDFDA